MHLEVGKSEDQKSGARIVADFWRDILFWLAFAAGPFVCFMAVWIYAPVRGLVLSVDDLYRLLILVIAYPVVEEIVFRGGLQGWLLGFSWGSHRFAWISAANVITSILFAGLHFFHHPPLMAALVFLPSLLFGFFRDRSGGLSAPMILHSSYNLVYFLSLGLPQAGL